MLCPKMNVSGQVRDTCSVVHATQSDNLSEVSVIDIAIVGKLRNTFF